MSENKVFEIEKSNFIFRFICVFIEQDFSHFASLLFIICISLADYFFELSGSFKYIDLIIIISCLLYEFWCLLEKSCKYLYKVEFYENKIILYYQSLFSKSIIIKSIQNIRVYFGDYISFDWNRDGRSYNCFFIQYLICDWSVQNMNLLKEFLKENGVKEI